jgi:hypothetical protein
MDELTSQSASQIVIEPRCKPKFSAKINLTLCHGSLLKHYVLNGLQVLPPFSIFSLLNDHVIFKGTPCSKWHLCSKPLMGIHYSAGKSPYLVFKTLHSTVIVAFPKITTWLTCWNSTCYPRPTLCMIFPVKNFKRLGSLGSNVWGRV